MCVVQVKSKVKISQNFVAFSEYMNFNAKKGLLHNMIGVRRTQTAEQNSFHEKGTSRYHFKENKIVFSFDLKKK